MADITPGTTHFTSLGMSLCGIEWTSDWREDDDAEFIYSLKTEDVTCESCLNQINNG